MPAMQHLMHYMTADEGRKSDYCCEHHFEYKLHAVTTQLTSTPNRHFSLSGSKPFLGHSTSTGTIGPLIHFTEKDLMLTKLKSLLELLSWTATSKVMQDGTHIVSNIDQFIIYLAGLFVEESVANLAPFAGKQKSEIIAHHIRSSSFKESIVPNCLSNVYQQITGDSNTHLLFRTVGDHFYINFLHILCYSIKIITFQLEFGPTLISPPVLWRVTEPCQFCDRVIIETPITIDAGLIPLRMLKPLKATRVEATGLRILRGSYSAFLEKGVIRDLTTSLTQVDQDIAKNYGRMLIYT